MAEDLQSAIATNTTLYRSLCVIADKHPFPDLIEQLALIAFERKLAKTSELLDSATDAALGEESTKDRVEISVGSR